MSCRKGGTISIPGVYVGMGDKIPIGAAMNKGLTFKTGQTHVQAYTKPLLEKIKEGKIDPSFVVTHPTSLENAPEMYLALSGQAGRRDQGHASTRDELKPNHCPCTSGMSPRCMVGIATTRAYCSQHRGNC